MADAKEEEEERAVVGDELRSTLEVKALTIVVFGGSGHLAKTKTFPALFELMPTGVYPASTRFVGYGRSGLSKEEFDERLRPHLKGDAAVVDEFLSKCSYVQGKSYGDPESFQNLAKAIAALEALTPAGKKGANRLCYLATPPSVFTQVCSQIPGALHTDDGWTRVIIEKPFGKDTDTYQELSRGIAAHLKEAQVYRIDHYLAKELVQNMLPFRFANRVWDALWDHNSIQCVKLSFKEDAGVVGRGGYYDEYGVIRDVLQNHLTQVLCLTAMEQPLSLTADDIRDAKVQLLKCIEAPPMERVVVGQYGPSVDGSQPGYRGDPTVKDDSKQVTFVQTILHVNNDRWKGVPFICKAGKGLDERKAEVRIQFKTDAGQALFSGGQFNELVIRIQPDEGIYLKINTKKPGFARATDCLAHELILPFNQSRFYKLKVPAAYPRLLVDSLRGDQSNFVREDELREAWRIFTPMIHHTEQDAFTPTLYPRGSRGPPEADAAAQDLGFKRTLNYQWPQRKLSVTKL